MALSRVKTWAAESLTYSDLNAEFDNILNNALTLISPLTGDLAFGGNRATGLHAGTVSSPSGQATGDTNTGYYFPAADTFGIATGGVQAASFGASWLLAAAPEDSRTNTVDVVGEIRSTTSGIPAAGIGTGLLFSAESQDENPSNVGEFDFVFSDIGTGTEDSYLDVLLRVAGAALAPAYQLKSTGTKRAIFTHANSTADRTYTLPDADSSLGTSFKVGSFTRDLTIASGTQAVTGVGFQPKAVLLFAAISSSATMSIGFDDATTHTSITDRQIVSADQWEIDAATYAIKVYTGATDSYTGYVSALGADGFTITWAKVNSPTGTLTINYLAIR